MEGFMALILVIYSVQPGSLHLWIYCTFGSSCSGGSFGKEQTAKTVSSQNWKFNHSLSVG